MPCPGLLARHGFLCRTRTVGEACTSERRVEENMKGNAQTLLVLSKYRNRVELTGTAVDDTVQLDMSCRGLYGVVFG